MTADHIVLIFKVPAHFKALNIVQGRLSDGLHL